MSKIILRQVFADSESLKNYLQGAEPKIDDIVRRLFLAERAINHRHPDHFYKNQKELVLGGVSNIGEMLIKTFNGLTEDNLDVRDYRVYVKPEQLVAWQDQLARVPPLPLVSFVLYREHGPPAYDPGRMKDYFCRFLRPNLGAST